jgi:hypothetical protein
MAARVDMRGSSRQKQMRRTSSAQPLRHRARLCYAIYAITLCARIGVCSVQVRDTVSLTTNDLSVAVALLEVDTEASSTQMTGFFAKKNAKDWIKH